jgi:hypothetical protein
MNRILHTLSYFCLIICIALTVIFTGSLPVSDTDLPDNTLVSKYLTKKENSTDKTQDSDWTKKAFRFLDQSQYFINFQRTVNTFQSPNIKQNLRITYLSNGFELTSRVSSAWKQQILVTEIQKGSYRLLPDLSPEFNAEQNKLIVQHQHFSIEYY